MAESRPPYGTPLRLREVLKTSDLDMSLDSAITPFVSVPIDETPRRVHGPRSIGVGRRFSAIANDLPRTVYDRTARNPFSPIEVEEDEWDRVLEGISGGLQLPIEISDDEIGTELPLASVSGPEPEPEDEEQDFHYTPYRELTVPWLPARRDSRVIRRSLTGWDNPSMEIANKGSLPSSGPIQPMIHSPNPDASPGHHAETNAGLGASIALSVILGLAAIGLTTWAGLSYRRKKKQNASRSGAGGKRAREDDEESFTCSGNEEGEEMDTEKALGRGLGSPMPSPVVLEGTPRASRGFKLWSPIPLFSPSSPSRSAPTSSPNAAPAPTAAPTRRAVLDNPARSTGQALSLTISTSMGSMGSNRSLSLLDALDSPIPLSLEPIVEETTSLRSLTAIDELHRRLSIASIASDADSMRRNSATSTYSSCSDRSSELSSKRSSASSSHHSNDAASISEEDIYIPERSFSFSSETPSVLIETPARVHTPTINTGGDSGTSTRETTTGLPLPTMPSAASIHEALDDMIGLFCPPPDVDHTRTLGLAQGKGPSSSPAKDTLAPTPHDHDHLAQVAAAIGKVAFSKDASSHTTNPVASGTFIPGSPAPVELSIHRPSNPLLKTAAFSQSENHLPKAPKPFITPLVDHPFTRTSRPSTPVRRHSLPIALLNRRVEKSAPSTPTRYSELYNKDNLQLQRERGIGGIRIRQMSLPTVSESELDHNPESESETGTTMTSPSEFVKAAYKFTAAANMNAERLRLENRRKELFTPAYDIKAVPRSQDQGQEGGGPSPERAALARFLASVSESEDDEESEESFSPYACTEWDDDDGNRWLVYEENFPLPDTGLPQIMVTCH